MRLIARTTRHIDVCDQSNRATLGELVSLIKICAQLVLHFMFPEYAGWKYDRVHNRATWLNRNRLAEYPISDDTIDALSRLGWRDAADLLDKSEADVGQAFDPNESLDEMVSALGSGRCLMDKCASIIERTAYAFIFPCMRTVALLSRLILPVWNTGIYWSPIIRGPPRNEKDYSPLMAYSPCVMGIGHTAVSPERDDYDLSQKADPIEVADILGHSELLRICQNRNASSSEHTAAESYLANHIRDGTLDFHPILASLPVRDISPHP